MRLQIRRPPHTIHEFEIVIHDQLHENRLNLQTREESPRTSVLAVAEIQHRGLGGGELVQVSLAGLLAHLVVAEAVKHFGARRDGRLVLDGADSHGKVGAFGEDGTVAEGVVLSHDAVVGEHAGRVEALALFDEAVEFAQFGEGALLPSAVFVARVADFFPQGLDVFGVRGEVVEDMDDVHLGSVDRG